MFIWTVVGKWDLFWNCIKNKNKELILLSPSECKFVQIMMHLNFLTVCNANKQKVLYHAFSCLIVVLFCFFSADWCVHFSTIKFWCRKDLDLLVHWRHLVSINVKRWELEFYCYWCGLLTAHFLAGYRIILSYMFEIFFINCYFNFLFLKTLKFF